MLKLGRLFPVVIAIAVFGSFSVQSFGANLTYYVEPGNSCGGNMVCFHHIQNAIDAAQQICTGDGCVNYEYYTIKVGEGTYAGPITMDTVYTTVECCWNTDFTNPSTAPIIIE